MTWINVLIKEASQGFLASSIIADTYDPGREFLPGIKYADALILDVPISRTVTYSCFLYISYAVYGILS